ncbi:MAG: hypothetical protein CMG46_10280 [Candidatus Marinimicrobia bacterium]|nr:hypothetical protein [Candidatus Neomarinimicrobiota bacterium]
MKPLVVILLPVILTIISAGLLRAVGGAVRGPNIAGIAVVGGFITSWAFLLSPGWSSEDSFERIGYIAVVAALAGLTLDIIRPTRFWTAVVAGFVICLSTWVSLNNGFISSGELSTSKALLFLVLAVVAFSVIVRLDQLRAQSVASYVVIIMVALALYTQAIIVGDSSSATTALILALCVAAYATLQLFLDVFLGDSVILGIGAALLAVAWAIAESDPSARIGLILVPLILFADGTAKHVPMPEARISSILYPIVLGFVASLPLGLGALITFVIYGP